MVSDGGKRFKIRLSSGRILGPLDLRQIRKFILKNRVVGQESAREHPQGDWADINSFSEIAELLLQHAEGRLQAERTDGPKSEPEPYSPLLHGHTQALIAPTVMMPAPGMPAPQEIKIPVGTKLTDAASTGSNRLSVSDDTGERGQRVIDAEIPSEPVEMEGDERTQMYSRSDVPALESEPATNAENPVPQPTKQVRGYELAPILPTFQEPAARDVAYEKTVVFSRSSGGSAASGSGQSKKRKKEGIREWIKIGAAIIVLGIAANDLFFQDEASKVRPDSVRRTAFRPVLPKIIAGASQDPAASKNLYESGLRAYQKDNVPGYLTAAERFLNAVSLDPGNVKALAMLASSYLNLIDSSNKDENYFSVISKLIEMSRAKSVDLAETVIADVEFYLTVNQAEAAKQRIIDYTRANKNFEPLMYYYVALAFEAKGDSQSAARYLTLYPDEKYKLPKAAYFRGRLAESFGDDQAAIEQYARAVQWNPDHGKSRLRTAEILYRRSRLKDAAPQLKYLTEKPTLLSPLDLSRTYFLLSRLFQLGQNWDLGLAAIERALKLDRDNTDYLLEFYTLRARLGEKVLGAKREAQMYTLMGEGQKLMAQGMVHEAMSKFLEARQVHIKSPTPLARLGDLFMRTGEISNARLNYQKATELAPGRVDLWTRYIHSLIESYDWEEATKAIERLRKLPVSQSSVDKLTGDLYFRQRQYTDALLSYRKAMSRETIDSSVYIAYADTLVEGGMAKDAPFFYSLAQRFDPLNLKARVGIARALAQSDSIDRAIDLLQDELQRGSTARAELLSTIAEFNIQRGEWKQAQSFVDQAKQANPEYALPWKLQAQIELSKESEDPKALDRALSAYKGYSDRNSSDPSGYLERYRLLTRQKKFDLAGEELEKIFATFPKYPNLHYFKGSLYAVMGNHKLAIEEFQIELKNNARSPDTMIALGRSLIEAGLLKEALEQFQRASILSPQASEPKAMTAYANFLLKNYPASVALYKAAIALDRGNPVLYKRIGAVYHAMGDIQSSREAFRTYLQMEPDAVDRAEIQKFL